MIGHQDGQSLPSRAAWGSQADDNLPNFGGAGSRPWVRRWDSRENQSPWDVPEEEGRKAERNLHCLIQDSIWDRSTQAQGSKNDP